MARALLLSEPRKEKSMRRLVGPGAQTVLVLALFVGSLAVLSLNVLASLDLPRHELNARRALQDAGRKLADAARGVTIEGAVAARAEPLNSQLRALTRRVLEHYPGIEGGFYVADGGGWFGGYAYPNGPHELADAPMRNDPPPLETQAIQSQVQDSLDKGENVLRTEDVGPSRVVIFTGPVGDHWPARLTVWLMFRLTGPEKLEAQLRGQVLSTALALGGVALALVLTWNLGRTLRRQRRAEGQLRDELRRAEHLAALGKLLAGVAHEVRNPLAGIRSTVQLWQRMPDTARTVESIDAVVAAVDRLNAIVTRLLFFARADSTEQRPVDLNRLVGESLDLVAAQAAGQGVALERDLAADVPDLPGSANALRQLVLNLINNALQAMPRGGRLHCSTRALDDGTLELCVADTGHGIPEADRAHLFEPFFTTRSDGTGLGLALCREIVENHRGRIALQNTGPEGTTFSVRFPVGRKGEGDNDAAGT
jgi:signal transduction histidine kinase